VVCPVFRLQGSGATFLRRDAGARTVLVFLICLLRTSRPSLTVSAGVLAHNALGPVRAAAAFFDAAASMMLRPHARIGELRYCFTSLICTLLTLLPGLKINVDRVRARAAALHVRLRCSFARAVM